MQQVGLEQFDVIVIGGGPAGLMAAAAAGRSGARTLLLEKGQRLGRKLIISGGGRCNVTNRKPFEELVRHIPGNGRFMFSAFREFGSEEIIRFFEDLGIQLKEEDHGRIFPVTDRAVTVAEGLIDYIRRNGVTIRLGAPVRRLLMSEERVTGVALESGERIGARAVVVAVGGKSVPRTGSTGDGYAWAREAGHTVTTLYPTEVPLTAGDPWIRERTLQGLSLDEVELTLWDPRGKKITTQRGDMIFTHFGLSGPAALRVSHYVSVTRLRQGAGPLTLTIDLLPDETGEALFGRLAAIIKAGPRKMVKNALHGILPERLIPFLLAQVGIDPATACAHLPGGPWRQFLRLVKALPVTITGTLSLEEAFVTGGGVSVREIDPKTMQSRLKAGLFFAGEVMDVHGHTGGYNITVAFSSGHVAGACAARVARQDSPG